MALILKRASVSRPSGEWNDDDYDVLADGVVVGRIMEAAAAPQGKRWLWTLAFWHPEDRTPTRGYELTLEAAMAALVAEMKMKKKHRVYISRVVGNQGRSNSSEIWLLLLPVVPISARLFRRTAMPTLLRLPQLPFHQSDRSGQFLCDGRDIPERVHRGG